MPAEIPSSQNPKVKNQRKPQILHCSSNFPAAPINAVTLWIILNSSLYHCIQYIGCTTQAFTFGSQHWGPTTTSFYPKSPCRWVSADFPLPVKATAAPSSPPDQPEAASSRGFHPPLGALLLTVHWALDFQDDKCHHLYSAFGHEKEKAHWKAWLFLIIKSPHPYMLFFSNYKIISHAFTIP